MKKLLIYTIFVLSLTMIVSGFTFDRSIENGKLYNNYRLNQTEKININWTIANIDPGWRIQNFTIPCGGNSTQNCTVWRNITYRNYRTVCSDYVTGCQDWNVTTPTPITVTLRLENKSVNIYNATVGLFDLDNNNSLVNLTYYRFFVTFGNIFNQSGIYTFDIDRNYYEYEIYDGELPFIRTRLHTILTRPGGKMTVRCTGYLRCSQSYFNTSNTTNFWVSLVIPDGSSLGNVSSMVYLNTSYLKNGTITYRTILKKSPLSILIRELPNNKSIENMTSEELMELWDVLQKSSARKISEIEAANKSNEVKVPYNVSIPYWANKEDILEAMINELNDFHRRAILNLTEQNTMMVNELTEKEHTIFIMENYTNELRKNYTTWNPTIAGKTAVHWFNESLTDRNYVINKHSMKLYSLVLFVLVLAILSYIVYRKKAYPGMGVM